MSRVVCCVMFAVLFGDWRVVVVCCVMVDVECCLFNINWLFVICCVLSGGSSLLFAACGAVVVVRCSMRVILLLCAMCTCFVLVVRC